MTPRARMIAAYRGQVPDTVPVAPEFWSYVPARLLGVDMIAFEREIPLWQALQQAFTHYRTEGWGAIWTAPPRDTVETTEQFERLDERTCLSTLTTRTPLGELVQRRQYDRFEPSTPVERPIKDLARDWPAYEHVLIGGNPEEIDWGPVQAALGAVGEDYLLEVALPGQFFDFIAQPREGGLEQAVLDLLDHPDFFTALHARYLEYARRFARAACQGSMGESFFIGCSWSCVSLIGPGLWRRWDLPVIRAMVEEVHQHGRLVHLHFHGRCMEVVEELASSGVDCICPFERPPGGNVTDLAELRRQLAGRVTMNGNVHTVETLIRGTPADVEREVAGILKQWGADRRRLILGTGDQVGWETPDENLWAMVDAARRLGRIVG